MDVFRALGTEAGHGWGADLEGAALRFQESASSDSVDFLNAVLNDYNTNPAVLIKNLSKTAGRFTFQSLKERFEGLGIEQHRTNRGRTYRREDIEQVFREDYPAAWAERGPKPLTLEEQYVAAMQAEQAERAEVEEIERAKRRAMIDENNRLTRAWEAAGRPENFDWETGTVPQ